MRTFQFHMPHFHMPKGHAANGAEHHKEPTARRLRKFEGAVDVMVIGGILVLAAAMVYGLVTASGDARWF